MSTVWLSGITRRLAQQNVSLGSPEEGAGSSFRDAVLSRYLEFRTMDKVHRPSDYRQVPSIYGPPLWSTGQRSWLHIQGSQVRLPELSDFLSSSGSGTGYTQPREDN
jgi:hypothetical protein